jgi:hypothetical protein
MIHNSSTQYFVLSTHTYMKITVNIMIIINNPEVTYISNLKLTLFLSVPEEKF